MNPPVDAPMSSASRPSTSMPKVSRACASLSPPRPTYGWSARDQRDLGAGLDLRARFGDDLAVDGHLRGENQRARALARRSQTPLGDELIESDLGIAIQL